MAEDNGSYGSPQVGHAVVQINILGPKCSEVTYNRCNNPCRILRMASAAWQVELTFNYQRGKEVLI